MDDLKMIFEGDNIRCNKNLYFFGCGVVARRIFTTYGKAFKISGFFTDYAADWDKVINGLKVYSPNEVLSDRNNFIIIATNKSVKEISDRFTDMGLTEGKDFLHYTKWLREYFKIVLDEKGQLLQDYGEIYITDRCNLRCKKCALFVPYFSNHKDRDLEEVKRDISLYFKFVDKVSVFRILGGETFLYRRLPELLTFIGGGGYREKAGRMILLTNGIIMPSEEVLSLLAKYKIEVLISDYPLDITKRQRPKILQAFKEANVICNIAETEWVDTCGNPKVVKYHSEDQIKEIFDKCYVWCRAVYSEKYYFCLNDIAAKRMGFVEESPQDYVDLTQADEKKIKADILTLDSKKTAKGYLNFCKNCFSLSPQNTRQIPVAEQLNTMTNF